jgi:hypothetical protein
MSFAGRTSRVSQLNALTRVRWNDSLLAPVASAKAERFTDYIRNSEHVK